MKTLKIILGVILVAVSILGAYFIYDFTQQVLNSGADVGFGLVPIGEDPNEWKSAVSNGINWAGYVWIMGLSIIDFAVLVLGIYLIKTSKTVNSTEHRVKK